MNQALTIENILNLKISYQKDTWSDIETDIFLKDSFEIIKTGKFHNQINWLRIELNNGNKEFYDNHKKKLQAITFSGSFDKKRTLPSLKKYNPVKFKKEKTTANIVYVQ